MKSMREFEINAGRGCYRPSGSSSAGELVDMITSALHLAQENKCTEVLINITSMSGFEVPGPAFRRWAIRRWAEFADPSVRIVVVARHEHICPNKTGLLAAAEFGLQAHICESEAEAYAWLDNASNQRFLRDQVGAQQESDIKSE